MTTRPAWQPEAKKPLIIKTPKEVLDNPPRRWPVPLMVLVAVLLGMGSGAWIAGNNERALDATAERLVEVSEDLESARAELATARDDLTTTQAQLDQLQGVERVADRARSDNATALEDLEQVVFAAAAMFDGLPPGAATGLAPVPQDLAVLERSLAVASSGDQQEFRSLFTRDGWLTFVVAGLHQEFRGDDLGTAVAAPPRLRLVGEPAQTGEFLWSRYVEADSSGVVVVELQGDKILHLWLVGLSW